MGSGEPRLTGWVDTRFSKRRGQYQSRLRYRPAPGAKPQTLQEVWHDPPSGRIGARRDAVAAADGRALLGDLHLDLTRRLRTAQAPSFQRGVSTTLGQFWDEVWFERELTRRPENTRQNYRYSFKNWIRGYIGGLSLADLAGRGTEIGQQWVDAMVDDGASVDTITYAISVAKSVLSDAIEWGWVSAAQNPFRYVRAPERPFVEQVDFALELEHVCLVAWMTPSLGDALWTELIGVEALRQQEIVPLRLSDLFHESRVPLDRMQITKAVSGKGRHRQIKELKGGGGRRAPELFAPIVQLARLYLDEEHPDAENPSARLFPAESWDGLRDMDNWRDDIWEPALRRAGIEQGGRYGRITPHRLRGAATSAYGYARWSQAELLTHVGHRSFTTSLDWYIRAYENPTPELRGMALAEQLRRARLLTLAKLQDHVELVAGAGYRSVEEAAAQEFEAARLAVKLEERGGDPAPGTRAALQRSRVWRGQVRKEKELGRAQAMLAYLERLVEHA